MVVAIAWLLHKAKKKKSPRVGVGVGDVSLMDIFRLLRVLLRTKMADKGTYRDVALPAAASAAAVEVAIHSSLFLSSSLSPRLNSYFCYRFLKYSLSSSVV